MIAMIKAIWNWPYRTYRNIIGFKKRLRWMYNASMHLRTDVNKPYIKCGRRAWTVFDFHPKDKEYFQTDIWCGMAIFLCKDCMDNLAETRFTIEKILRINN
jgi:hypothetical protein